MNTSGNAGIYRQLFSSKLSRAIDATYVTISVAGIILNALIVLLFCKEKSLRKPFNILLHNLSVADMLSAIAIQPYVWIDATKLGGNSAAGFLCASSVGLAFFMSFCLANILTLLAITVIRYLGIVRNYQGKIVSSKNIAASFCIMTWVIAAGVNLPNWLSYNYDTIYAICYRKSPKGINISLYSLLTTLLFGSLPFLITIILYTALVVHIWRRSFETPGRNLAAVRARKRVAVLVGCLILALILCWSPFFSVWAFGRMSNYFSEGADGEYDRMRLLRVVTIFVLCNSILDPAIYIFSSPEYRKGIVRLICDPWRKKESAMSVKVFIIGSNRELNLKVN